MAKRQKKSERVVIRLSPEEKAKLVYFAESKGQSESWVLREYIRRLPAIPKPKLLPPATKPVVEIPASMAIGDILALENSATLRILDDD